MKEDEMRTVVRAAFVPGLGLSLFLSAVVTGAAQDLKTVRVAGAFIHHDLRPGAGGRFQYSPEVVADPDGSVRLAHSVLLADETGATDFRQTEALSDRVHGKKVFQLDSADVTAAEVFLFGEAKKIAVNGKTLEKSEPLVSTGWTRAKIPPGYLKAGANELVFSGGGSLLIEPGRRSGRSSKSSDGGRTWSDTELGARNHLQGEYLVRLRLSRCAPRGWVLSEILDLWGGTDAKGTVAVPGKLTRVKGLSRLRQGRPAGVEVRPFLRTGSTPAPDVRSWTDWVALDNDYSPDAAGSAHRWAQVKVELATSNPQLTPRLYPFRLEAILDLPPEPIDDLKQYRIFTADNADVALSSVRFDYDEPSPRLKLLRERYELDKVIAPGATEMEQLMLLRWWVRHQCHRGWASHPALYIPPWDALLILENRDRPDCLVMCTHYSAVFTQCCQALGWNARHCILDHHCVSEVWVDQHRKWVMMDTGNSAERADAGLHFERKGVPLSARELQQVYRDGKGDDLTVCFTPARLAEKIAPLCRPAPAPKVERSPRPDSVTGPELKKYPVCQLDNYRRYAFPPRNTFLTTLYPGELEHGFSNYFYDGYCWVGNSPDDPRLSPEYSTHLTPSRPQDVDWSLNWVRAHLARTPTKGELRVDLETLTPNLERLERAGPGERDAWQQTPAGFSWKLQPGVNVLRLRSVNRWGRAGQETVVKVEWKPPQ
jgi:hypothetical protein